MKLNDSNRLARECQVFTSYLSGLPLDPYVLQKYVEAHQKVVQYRHASSLDQILLQVARKGPAFTRLADSYARVFAPTSTLRKKLILLLAILESTALGRGFLGRIDTQSRPLLILAFALKGLLFVVRLFFATAVLLPLQLILPVLKGKTEEGR